MDSLNSQPIEYVSISVINNNKDIETGGITNSKGVFEIKGIKPGTYSVRIEFMGFSTIEFRDIKLAFSGAIWKKDFGIIKLQSTSLELEPVMVIDDKPIFEFKADKMVYDADTRWIILDVREIHNYLRKHKTKIIYLDDLVEKLEWSIYLPK